MELLTALLILLCPRDVVPLRHAPLYVGPGTVQTIPDPLPYVLSDTYWGPR